MKHSMSSALAWGGVLLAGALWGGGAIVAQLLMEQGMSPDSLALARFALGLPLLWLWQHLQQHQRTEGRAASLQWRDLGWRDRIFMLGTGAATALAVTSWFAAITVLGAGLPTLIAISCAPVFVTLVSVLRGYERLNGRVVAALVLALAGLVAMVLPSGHMHLPEGYGWGIALSLASAAAQAVVVLGNARMPSRISPATASAWGMTAAALCMAVVAVPKGLTLPAGWWGWLGLAYTGVITTSVAYLMFAWGARRLTPTAAIIGIMVEPLVAVVLASWLLAEPMAARQWAGAALLGGAVWLLMRDRGRAGPP